MYKLNEMRAENIEKNELRIEKELRTQENKIHGGTTKNPSKI